MATVPQAAAALAKASAGCISQRMLESYFGEIRAAKMVRPSGPGRARAGAVDLDAGELALILLAMASPGPDRTVETVKTLAGLEWERPEPGDHVTLLGFLSAEVYVRALRNTRGEPMHGNPPISDWTLTVSIELAAAWFSWTINGREYRRHYASAVVDHRHPQSGRPMMRLTRLNDAIVDCAAEMLAESMIAGPRNGNRRDLGRVAAA